MEKKRRPTSFFSKLLIYFMIVSLLPIIFLGFFTNFLSNKISEDNVMSQLKATAESAGSNIDSLLEEYKNGLNLFCEDEELHEILTDDIHTDNDVNSIYKKIYLLLAGRTSELNMHVIRSDNSFSVSTTELPQMYNTQRLSYWGLFRAVSESNKSIVYTNRYISERGVKIAISVAKAIRDKDRILGYAIIDIPEQALRTVLLSSNSILPVDYTIMDSRFYVVYDEAFSDLIGTFFNLEFRDSLAQGEYGSRFYDLNENRVLVANKNLRKNDIILLCTLPLGMVIQNNDYIKFITVVLAIAAGILCFIASLLIAQSITRPIKGIGLVMKRVEEGDMTARAQIINNDEIGFMARGLNKMIAKLDELFKTNLEKQDRLRLAEIKNLYSQINPHFLYNTLDSLKWLAKLNRSDEINIIVEKLGILLKNSINNKKDIITVEENIKIIDSYLAIQKIRYSDKINVDISIDPDIYECNVPKLIIQPIVENAIIHGIENKMGNANLSIKGYRKDDDIVFEISDDGVGIDDAKLGGLIAPKDEGGSGIGLMNSDRRIKLYYGEKYGIDIKSKVGIGTTVTITMPMIKMEGSSNE